MPADIGNCQNYSALWYFDTKIKRCRQFYYGGCGGNDNRFNSETECDQRCRRTDDDRRPPPTQSPATQAPPQRTERPQPEQTSPPRHEPVVEKQRDICLLPYESGNCRERHRRFYFDRSYGICTQFAYSGCDGNENNFETREECEDLCNDAVDFCDLASLGGRCDENITRWYFDAYSGRCHVFDYSGCDGNRNNFDDERSCMHACQHKREEDTGETQPPVFTQRPQTPAQTQQPQTQQPQTQRPPAPDIVNLKRYFFI